MPEDGPLYTQSLAASQKERRLPALDPASFSVDERSLEDLLRFAQRYAGLLRYFDDRNQPDGTWTPFLSAGKPLETALAEIVHYLEDPAQSPQDDPWRLRPHLHLFLTFLELLKHAQGRLNTLTERHLDFYYREALRLHPRAAVPDQVHVLMDLAEGQAPYLLPKDTRLAAATDSQGNDLVYQTDHILVVNDARVDGLRTVFVDKLMLDIREARTYYRERPDGGFRAMMQVALGDPRPGDPLPPFPWALIKPPEGTVDFVGTLDKIAEAAADPEAEHHAPALAYVKEQLYLPSAGVLRFILEVQKNKDATFEEWEEVYRLLAAAYRIKVSAPRLLAFKEAKEKSGVAALLALALSKPQLEGMDAGTLKNKLGVLHLRRELYLDDRHVDILIKAVDGEEVDWGKIYAFLHLAERAREGEREPEARSERWLNTYSAADATEVIRRTDLDPDATPYWMTFGSGPQPGATVVQAAQIGFALASPTLRLEEGTRTITLCLVFQTEGVDTEGVDLEAIARIKDPFQFFLTTADGWTQVKAKAVTLVWGVQVIEGNQPLDDYTTASVEDRDNNGVFHFTKSGGAALKEEDLGCYVVVDRSWYRIWEVLGPDTANVKPIRKKAFGDDQTPKKYAALAIQFSVEIKLVLGETVPPIVPDRRPEAEIESRWPVMKVILREEIFRVPGRKDRWINHYHTLRALRLASDKVKLDVEVDGLKSVSLRNDIGELEADAPFEPFGYEPAPGSSFYVAHPELSYKKLTRLDVEIDWMGVPKDLAKHYENYITKDLIKDNAAFTVALKFHDNRAVLVVKEKLELFDEDATKPKTNTIPDLEVAIRDHPEQGNYTYTRETRQDMPDDVLAWRRFFQLALNAPDFQHRAYPPSASMKAVELAKALKGTGENDIKPEKYVVNPPYTPEIQGLRFSYTASVAFDPRAEASADDRFLHIHPFGYSAITAGEGPGEEPRLLPDYDDQGSLYIGIEGLEPPQHLSLLFQLAEGSADPETPRAEVRWDYLHEDRWQSLMDGRVLGDTTHGLINTGIVLLDLPAAADTDHRLLPAGRHWLRASVARDARSVCDTIAIEAQAVQATLRPEGVAPDHYSKPLPPESITGLVEPHPEIASVRQPYSSARGRAAEAGLRFYTRVSERLRHKQRALTGWDYERLLLERFPEIYKTRCLPAAQPGYGEAGRVILIVIPDLRDKVPFDPFQPKVPVDVLASAEAYLSRLAPSVAAVTVKNPVYILLEVRFAVRFREGLDAAFYRRQLNEELRQFLTPWAYDPTADIPLGGTFHASTIVNFVDKRPYVDYMAGLQLFQSADGGRKYVPPSESGGYDLIISRPDAILVSVRQHEIDLITTRHYIDGVGIGYMRIERDFYVAEDHTS